MRGKVGKSRNGKIRKFDVYARTWMVQVIIAQWFDVKIELEILLAF